jgi:hypothetical protein
MEALIRIRNLRTRKHSPDEGFNLVRRRKLWSSLIDVACCIIARLGPINMARITKSIEIYYILWYSSCIIIYFFLLIFFFVPSAFFYRTFSLCTYKKQKLRLLLKSICIYGRYTSYISYIE